MSHQCNVCDKLFTTYGNMNKHIRDVHLQERNFHCDQCDKRFKRKEHLSSHISAIHRLERPFKCDLCDYAANNSHNLKKHVQAVHNSERRFACPHCNHCSAMKSNLLLHIKRIHNNIRDLTCKYCPYMTADQSDLRNHINRIHINPKPKSMSRLEQRVSEILIDQNVQFTREFTFDNLRGSKNGLLRFDFAIHSGNDYRPILLIEADGDQHTRPVTFGYLTDDQAIENFERIQRHDELKNLYCAEAGYPLLRLRLAEYKHFEDLIVGFLDKYL